MTSEWLMVIIMWCRVAPDTQAEKECRQAIISCVRGAIHPEECFIRKPRINEEVAR